ncbi:hypothetical protein Avbf_06309 [Armadillidium vulgare]|nr:hypothetical protein Avbf_06309 [Armadillidium vulgare]
MLNTGEVVISIPDDSKGNEKTSPFPSLLYVTDSGVVIGVLAGIYVICKMLNITVYKLYSSYQYFEKV